MWYVLIENVRGFVYRLLVFWYVKDMFGDDVVYYFVWFVCDGVVEVGDVGEYWWEWFFIYWYYDLVIDFLYFG